MNKCVSKFLVLAFILWLSFPAYSNEIIDVGVGPAPSYDPRYYDPTSVDPAWTLSSSCADINESGQAACRSLATGPIVKCGFRGIRRCGSKVAYTFRWDGVSLVLVSDKADKGAVPQSMNNAGEITGYEYKGGSSSGDNGRIWHAPFNVEQAALPVSFINDRGDYILKNFVISGGIVNYNGTVHTADGTQVNIPGTTLFPFVIAKNGDVVAGQIIQEYVPDISSPTGNEIPEVSGVGWVLDQSDIDAIGLNQAGLLDVDQKQLWPLDFYRPNGLANYSTIAYDTNDYSDFVGTVSFGGLHNSYYCTREGETDFTDYQGVTHRLPWVCDGTNYLRGTYAGGKLYRGINNHGDIVGQFTPGVSGYSNNITRYPWVWLVNATGGLDEFNANNLLPAASGYTVLTVNDINDRREIAATCNNALGEQRGCILKLTDFPVPADTIKPTIRIDSPLPGAVSGIVTIKASAWDRQSRLRQVNFKVGKKFLGVDKTRPYSRTWDTSKFADGNYVLKAVAIDMAGNRRVAKMTVTVGGIVPKPPGGGGTSVEDSGTILAVGADYIDVKSYRVFYDAATIIKFNDVSGFAVGLPVQFKGIKDNSGKITALQIEVN